MMAVGWISLDKEENIISSNPIEMVFKQSGKYLNALLIFNCNNEAINYFEAKHRRIYTERNWSFSKFILATTFP